MLACTPHPGLGTVSVRHSARVTVVDLSTCRQTTHPAPGQRFVVPGLTARGPSLAYAGRRIAGTRRGWGIVPLALSPDRRWAFFMIDPFDSASILNDGLPLRVVSTAGGRVRTLPTMLLDGQYRTWCGGELVLTAGEDRLASHGKRLVVASAPGWKARPLLRAPGRAFGASTCAPDRRSVVVQSQRDSIARPYGGNWTLWRVTLAGAATELTHPPKGFVDESPRYARHGTIYFVRSRRGRGALYALRRGRVVGPLLSLGTLAGWFGLRDWPYTVTG